MLNGSPCRLNVCKFDCVYDEDDVGIKYCKSLSYCIISIVWMRMSAWQMSESGRQMCWLYSCPACNYGDTEYDLRTFYSNQKFNPYLQRYGLNGFIFQVSVIWLRVMILFRTCCRTFTQLKKPFVPHNICSFDFGVRMKWQNPLNK